MFKSLKKYVSSGYFSFSPQQVYTQCCNAPTDRGGIYLIYGVKEDNEVLLYIGSSGQRNKDGGIKIRKGGMRDRLINGYHPNQFGKEKRIKRSAAFPQQMQVEGIDTIKVYWWVTWDENFQDFPTDIEKMLQNEYCTLHGRLPAWHRS